LKSMSFENGYAILIGVDDNKVKKWALPNVKNDVVSLGQVLRDPERCGFPANNMRILTSKNANQKDILDAFEWLKDQIDKNETDVTAVIYYSGHGWRDSGANPLEYYLIPYDVSEKEIRTSALKAGEFAAKIEILRPRRLLVILDCCHSAGMGVKDITDDSSFVPSAIPSQLILKGKTFSASAGTKGLEELKQGSGRAVLSSSSGEQSSYMRKDGKMSIFTYHLIQALTGHAQPQEGARQVLVSDVMGHVWRKVPESAMDDWGEEQDPDYQVSGNFPVALLLGGKTWQKGQLAPNPLEHAEISASTVKVVSQENLPEVLGVPWVRTRSPIISDQEHEKVDSAVNQVLMGKRVVIIGDAGIGKTTLLYLVCRRLLELDVKLYTGAPPPNMGNFVFVSDNLPRDLNLLTQLSSLNISVIAASRKYEWLNTPGWTAIELTKNDYSVATLREVLSSVAIEKKVGYSNESIDLAVEKSGGSPGYLVALVDYLRQSNHALDKQTASNVPSTIYDVEAEQLSCIAKAQGLSVSVLYAIAKTKQARLHMDQTSILITRLKELKEGISQKTSDKPDAWAQITFRDRDLYTIKHDTWKDLLLVDWKKLRIETSEPDALIEARNLPIENMLEEIFESSISHLANWKTESAIRLAQVAVENQSKLAMQLIELVTTAKGKIPSTMKPLLMDLAAIKNPVMTRTWLQGLTIQRLSEVQLESDEAPSYMILWCEVALEKEDTESPSLMERSNSQISYVSETMQKLGSAYRWKGLQDEAIERLSQALDIYRQLANRDKQFKPNLAKTLTVLGESYREKGMLDKSIECLKEARDINREHCPKNEPRKADLAEALSDLGSAYWWEGRLDQAIECSDEALNIYREMVKTDENLRPDLARTLTILGASYRERGNLTESVDSLEEASSIYDELSHNNDRFRYDHAYVLYNLGAAYWWKGTLDKATDALEDALTIDRDYADKDVRGTRDLARTLNNLGIAYRWQGRTDKAIETLEEARYNSRKLTDKEGHFKSDIAAYVYVTTLCNLSAAYHRKGMMFDKAVKGLKEALDINRAIAEKGGPFILGLIDILITLGLIFVSRGTADDLDSARALSTEAQKLLEKEEHQQPNSPEYVALVRGQEDLQSLLLVS
jgi:tetratricopeptide (TPR) repeat protein